MPSLWFQATVLEIGLAPPVAEGKLPVRLCFVVQEKINAENVMIVQGII